MARVLVTAAGGFLGRHACEALQSQGHSVLTIGDLGPSAPPSGCETLPKTRSTQELAEVLQGVDAVMLLLDYSVEDTNTLLQALEDSGVTRLVVESSLEIYGEGLHADGTGRMLVPEPRPVTDGSSWQVIDADGLPMTPLQTPETTAPAPVSPRGIAALEREMRARRWAEGGAGDRHLCILRLAPLFGAPAQGGAEPQDDVWRMMAEVKAARPVQLAEDGGRIRDWLHVRDAARALRLAVDHCDRSKGAVNIGARRGYSDAELAHLIGSAAFRYDLEPQTSARPAEAARHLVGMPGIAKEHLGFSPELPLENTLGELSQHMGLAAKPA